MKQDAGVAKGAAKEWTLPLEAEYKALRRIEAMKQWNIKVIDADILMVKGQLKLPLFTLQI